MEQAVDHQAVTAEPLARSGPHPNAAEAWDVVTSQLRSGMNHGLYEGYIAPLKPLGISDEGVFRLGGANRLALEWVESRFGKSITNLLDVIYNKKVTLRFSVLNGAYQRDEAPVVERGGGVVEPAPETAVVPADRDASAPEPARTRRSARAKSEPAGPDSVENASPRKIQLQRAYGTQRARIIQPERALYVTHYFLNGWLPVLGQSAVSVILAARMLCYWNPMTGELRNTIETDMADLARRAAVSVRTVKDVLSQEYVRQFFLRYKVRRVMTPNGVRTAGIVLQVRMDDPLTPEDQREYNLPEEDRWYTVDFEDDE